MIIFRMARGVIEHFPTRASEWALGVILLNWGWILLMPHDVFRGGSYLELARLFSEDTWGWLCLAVGTIRVIALIVNGTFSDTAYSRLSPHVRAMMAFLSVFFWFQITLSFLQGTAIATGVAVYPVFLFLDGYNVMRCAMDARRADEAAKHARGS